MRIKQSIDQRKSMVTREVGELAVTFVNKAIDKLYNMASSDEVFSARWILVHLNKQANTVEFCFGIRDYVIIESQKNSICELFDEEIVPGVKQLSSPAKKQYRHQVFEAIKVFLDSQSFANIENELPVEFGILHPETESYQWYALEI